MRSSRLGCFLLLCTAFHARADSRSSANYAISDENFDSGGQRAGSLNYQIDSSVGSLVVGSSAGGSSIVAEDGYSAGVVEVVAIAINATPSVVFPNGTSQLSGSASLDDGTFLSLAGNNIVWETPGFPILTISPAGLITTGSPETNTLIKVRGSYLGVFGESTVLVRAALGSPEGTRARVVSGPIIEHGQFVVNFVGAAGHVFTIESSSDLVHWVKVTNLVASAAGSETGVFQLRVDIVGFARRYFRTVYPAY